MAAAAGWSYYISAESLAKFLAPIYAGLDSLLVSGGKDQVLDLLRTLVETLVNQKVADGANSLFDLIKFAYGDHLHGDETCPAWVEGRDRPDQAHRRRRRGRSGRRRLAHELPARHRQRQGGPG